jgi:predicted ATP-grasp superfamily ATP-dependent carboligase
MDNLLNDIAEAVIISAGWSPGAYDIVRSLGMAGLLSRIASSQPNDIAFYSRYCTDKLPLPCFSPGNYGEILNRLQRFSVRRKVKPVLFYASDPELWFVWQFRNELAPYYRFLLPPDTLLEHLFNKVKFCELAARFDLPIPTTRTAMNIEDLECIIDSIELPCIVKPAYSQDWIWDTEEQRARFGPYKNALRRFETKEQVLDFCRALPPRSSGFLIQSYIDGRDETIESFHGYFDADSKCLGYFLGRKIRTYPPHTGGSTYVRTVSNPYLAQLSIEYLQRIGFQGIVKIDYKWNREKHEFNILEINPRYNLWELLGAYAGVNLVAIALEDQMGNRAEPAHGSFDNVRLLYFKQDLRSFWSGYRTTREWTLGSYLSSYAGKKYYRVYDPLDPLPFCHSCVNFFKRNALRLLGFKVSHDNPRRIAPVVEGHQAADGLDVRVGDPGVREENKFPAETRQII